MKAYQLKKYNIEEYYQLEKELNQKFEFHNGEVYALAGGTINHGLLCGNIYSELRKCLDKGNSTCKPLNGEIKLNISTSKNESFVYPDCMVICGQFEFSKADKNAVTNPTVIIEVLSKSTADYDRGDKFYLYRQIPTLKEYLLIQQDKCTVEIFSRHPKSDLWKITRVEGIDSQLHLSSLDISIPLKDLYYDIIL